MKQYLDLVELVLTKGRHRTTSVQGVGNTVYAGHEMRFRPAEAFPLLTTRSLKGSWKAMVAELLWFLSGSNNIADLHAMGVHLWDPWATEEICKRKNLPPGSIGRSYGPQWRNWLRREDKTLDVVEQMLASTISAEEKIASLTSMLTRHRDDSRPIDQISDLIKEITTRPDSKRMKVTAWNPEDITKVFIAPCHGDFKCVVAEGVVDLCMTQRSCDLPIGIPFNMASYSLLLLMIAQVTSLKPGEFVHHLQDIHIYDDQVEPFKEQLKRQPRPLPQITLNPEVKNIFAFTLSDFTLSGYDPHPAIKGIPVGV